MDMGPKGRRYVRTALREAVRGWIYDPNVMLIDFGWPEHGGVLAEDELAIRVHVVKKLTRPELELAARTGITGGLIPSEIAGLMVDVPESGVLECHRWGWGGRPRRTGPRARRTEPMQGGISVSNAYTNGYGTLGGLVTDRETGKPMMLSNWHVLAAKWHARPGWPIYQPGKGDGGSQEDTVAKLCRDAMDSDIDAAVAKLTGSRELANHMYGLGPVKGLGWAHLGMEVVKSGRRTGVTYGRVTGIGGTARIPYRRVRRTIRSVMTIVPRISQGQVSEKGDSGAFWLQEETMHAVGLHFAGGNRPEHALAIDMHTVLDALNVNLVF
jgi:endonuclease G